MRILEAIRANRALRLAIVGAGGKTSTMFALARQIEAPVIVTASAHLALEQAQMADQHVIINSPDEIDRALNDGLQADVVLFTGPTDQRGRTRGLDGLSLEKLRQYADDMNSPLLLEADGARCLALKAPAAHEPPIPGWVNHVIVVSGLSALGKPLDETTVFRSEIFSSISGNPIGTDITINGIVDYLLAPNGGLKNIPIQAQRTILLNQTDLTDIDKIDWEAPIQRLLSAYNRILLGVMSSPSGISGLVIRRFEKIAGIVLAAGESTRFGAPKQLLMWRGKSFIRHVTERAIEAGLNPVLVIVGAVVEPIRQALDGLGVQMIENPDWEKGLSGSVRSGLINHSAEWGGAIFLMSDMPQVTQALIKDLIEIHQREFVQIVVPRVAGRRTNPVFFDQGCFSELMKITGDTGGRVLFDRYPIHWLDWDDPNLLLDIDTIEDYQELNQLPLNTNHER